MTIHHAVWSEGIPDEAVHSTSWWRMQLAFARLQLGHLVRLRTARRVRHATGEAAIDPRKVELRLEVGGAIAPPGGWPPRRERDAEAMASDVDVRTHSVI